MQLKTYQENALETLRRFLEEARLSSPPAAYEEVTRDANLGRYGGKYVPINGLDNTPYVCLRLPTGGGKTILAAHAVKVAATSWIEKDYPVVLWLTPSNTIRQQTAEALKNPRHPYRQAIDDAFGGKVRVFDIADFTQIRPADLTQGVSIIVGTIQTLRVTDTEGRKVYAHNENLEPHFAAIGPSSPGLERIDEGPGKGDIRFSFANLMFLHQPLLIVDEAHNAVTGLSRDMQQRIRPSCIIEFTATPKPQSNIIYSVSASELKAAEMIKLPIILTEHPSWQQAVNGAVVTRNKLAKEAATDRDYIRPIVLFQAQNQGQEVTHEVLRQHLIDNEKIDPEHIAVVTGDQRELDGINLFDPACRIEYVITVQALKEGWDCSFAYVFCSVANIKSARDVEQLLGRVLRMPYARRRGIEDLNRAYAHVSERNFSEAAAALKDKLISMGFEEEDARDNILHGQLDYGDGGLPMFSEKEAEPFKYTLSEMPDLAALPEDVRGAIEVAPIPAGGFEVTIRDAASPAVAAHFIPALPKAERKAFEGALAFHRQMTERRKSPAERGESFNLPRLAVMVQGELELADKDVFLDLGGWKLSAFDPRLSEAEFSYSEAANSFEIKIEGRKVIYERIEEQTQLALNILDTSWDELALVRWLDVQIRQPDISQVDLLEFIRRAVADLVRVRGIDLPHLVRAKYKLAKALADKIKLYRNQATNNGYQAALFASGAKVEASFDYTFTFDPNLYPAKWLYRGSFRFSNHFYGPDRVGELKVEGEEFQCAQALDRLPGLKYWIRNIDSEPELSFWLPTSSGRFYPDFVAELQDGRLFIVEYKGDHLIDGAQEKRNIGQLWEERSHGKGLFIMVEKTVGGVDMMGQLLEKVSGK